MPYQAESAIASLLKRTQQRAIPVSDIDKNVPGALSNIVSKCLERDPALRYQSSDDLLNDLRAWQGKGGAARVSASSTRLWMNRLREVSWSRIAPFVLLLVVVVAATAWYFSRKKNVAVVTHAPVSVLVADFTNHTGDPIFDDTLEPMFNVALEGATFINAYSRGTARNLAKQLPHPSDKLDEQSARLIGVSQGLGAIVTGSLSLRGDAYKLSVEALDAGTGNSIATAEITAATKDKLLLDIPKLAAPIRKALGDTTPVAAQLAVSGPFTAASLEVVHLYSVAMQQQFAGKPAEAIQTFSKAVELDPNFALAYAGMSGPALDLGRQADAEKYIKLAMEHMDRMTERERYHTRGFYYLTVGNYPKCVEEYSTLVGQYPADVVGQSDLSWCYADLRNFPKAVEAARKAVEITPKGAVGHFNLAFFSSLTGDFQTGEREARTALEISPSEAAQLNLGEAQLGQGKLSDAAATYHGLEKFGPRGASLATSALADLALYQGHFSEAVRLLSKAPMLTCKPRRPRMRPLSLLPWPTPNCCEATVRPRLRRLRRPWQMDKRYRPDSSQGACLRKPEMQCKRKRWQTASSKRRKRSLKPTARSSKESSRLSRVTAHWPSRTSPTLTPCWIVDWQIRAWPRLPRSRTVPRGRLRPDRCLKRRGEALELFMDNTVTYSYLPYVYYYQGRVRQGLKTPGLRGFLPLIFEHPGAVHRRSSGC